MMWWLTFLNGGVVIIEASSLTHARSLAAAHGLGRVVHFAEGHFINPESAALIPDAFIGRMLSAIEARRLLGRVGRGPPLLPRKTLPDDHRGLNVPPIGG